VPVSDSCPALGVSAIKIAVANKRWKINNRELSSKEDQRVGAGHWLEDGGKVYTKEMRR
jgi:hypothetical protein